MLAFFFKVHRGRQTKKPTRQLKKTYIYIAQISQDGKILKFSAPPCDQHCFSVKVRLLPLITKFLKDFFISLIYEIKVEWTFY